MLLSDYKKYWRDEEFFTAYQAGFFCSPSAKKQTGNFLFIGNNKKHSQLKFFYCIFFRAMRTKKFFHTNRLCQ